MMIHVTESAAKWYKKELELQEGQAVRFFARYSAGGHIHPGFSLGIGVENPDTPGCEIEAEGIKFYMEEQDLWYLEGYDLKVTYDEALDDIAYEYVKVKDKTA
nr:MULTISPECIES: HesB/YadR/YfhF family protein [Paenibacillus]